MVKKRKHLGFSFPDEVARVTSQKKSFIRKEQEGWKDFLLPGYDGNPPEKRLEGSWQIAVFISLCLILFFTLFLKVFHLQIMEGKVNKNLADGNRIQIKIIHAPRGAIFDRNGQILAANSPAFRLFDNISDEKKVRVISREEALELEVKNDPRVSGLEVDNVRTYPQDGVTSHIAGYVGEISADQLKSNEFSGYRIGDRIGQVGAEAFYEKILKGKDGGEIIEVDSLGRKLRVLRQEPAVSGQNIYLTIDLELQKKLYGLLKEATKRVGVCCAASVASDPNTGQILALVSYPSFDPNIFTKAFDERAISKLFSRSDSPILNRVISGTYPPGSTFKIVSSLAALDSDKITPQTTFIDNGVVYIDSFSFSNWYFSQYGRTEGAVDVVKALQRSNDIYFYESAKVIGEQTLIDWSRKLYLGRKSGIDLPSEVDGLVPDHKWKENTYGEIWYPGDTLHLSIGQGFLLTTPLQILGITSFIASGGVLYKPQVVSKIEHNGQLISKFRPEILVSHLVSDNHLQAVKSGLEKVPVNGGTAWPFFTFPIKTAGKTGTAEFGDPKNKTHAWYTGYAPSNDPKIAMTVLIEGGGEGSSVAAPIVKEAFRYYLSEDKNNLIKDINIPASDSGRTLGE